MKYKPEELLLCIGLPCIFNNADNYLKDTDKVDAIIKKFYTFNSSIWYVKVEGIHQMGEAFERVLAIPDYDKIRNNKLVRLII